MTLLGYLGQKVKSFSFLIFIHLQVDEKKCCVCVI